MDEDTTSNDLVGEAEIAFIEFMNKPVKPMTVSVFYKGKDVGTITLIIEYL